MLLTTSNSNSSGINVECGVNITQLTRKSFDMFVVVSVNRNKDKYKQYRRRLSYLAQNIHHDAVSGWLMLASFYYKMKQYNTALYIINYALSKCTPEKVCYQENVTDWQYELIKTRTVQSLDIANISKLLRVSCVIFTPHSTLIPEELELEVVNNIHILPPVVYSFDMFAISKLCTVLVLINSYCQSVTFS
jgi:hypothetical protein